MATVVRYMYEGESRLISKVNNLCCLKLRYYKTVTLKCELCRLVGDIQAPNVMTL